MHCRMQMQRAGYILCALESCSCKKEFPELIFLIAQDIKFCDYSAMRKRTVWDFLFVVHVG